MTSTFLTRSDSEQLDQRALAVLPGGTTRGLTAMMPMAPRVVRGEGFTVHGERGQKWIDLNNNFTALIHGHSHPSIVEAATRAMEAGASFGLSTIAEIELAELLVERIPWTSMVRFCNSGTEAIMAAIRAARVVTGRDKIVLPRPSYHGSSDHALVALGSDSWGGITSSAVEEVLLVDPYDEAELEAVFANRGDEIAGYILDLAPSRAGGVPLQQQYVQRARELTRAHGALLITDEVVTLRHGYAGMGYSVFGIVPDIVAVGKIMGGGHPIGAVLGAADVMSCFDPRSARTTFHGGTFSGNPVSMRAGAVSMELLTRSEVDRLIELGDHLRGQLRTELVSMGWEPTGFGSSIRFNFVGEDEPLEWRKSVWWAAEARGLLLTGGNASISLSTPMDVAVVDEIAIRVVESFAKVRQQTAVGLEGAQ